MKTKNAFALRDFDKQRILQRPFFKTFRFGDKTDEEILKTLDAADEDSVDDMENKLETVKAVHERLEAFMRLIDKHCKERCDKYNRIKMKMLGVDIFELQRRAPTLEYFTASLDCIELADKLAHRYFELEKKIQERYQRELAARIKEARLKLGMRQKELGDKVQVSPQGFSRYERCERDIPIHTVIRLAKVLGMSGDEILGLK